MAFPILRTNGLTRAVFFLAVFLFGPVPIGPGNGFGSGPQDQQTPQAKEKSRLGGAARTPQKSTKEDERLHLQGVLVEGGAECQRFRAENDTFYTLEGDLHGFRTGDRVKITGVIPQVSHCMQDTPLRVISIERAKPRAAGTDVPLQRGKSVVKDMPRVEMFSDSAVWSSQPSVEISELLPPKPCHCTRLVGNESRGGSNLGTP
jgi:hypothetical protein